VSVSITLGNFAFAQAKEGGQPVKAKQMEGMPEGEAIKAKKMPEDMTEEEKKKMVREYRDDESEREQNIGNSGQPVKAKNDNPESESKAVKVKEDITEEEIKQNARKMEDMTEEEKEALKAKYEQSKKERGINEMSNSLSESELDDLQDRYLTMISTEKNSPEFNEASLTPIQQQVIDVEPEEVVCKDGLQLVIRTATGQPSCVKTNTAIKMIERGIAMLG
jgi:hypothetical protein